MQIRRLRSSVFNLLMFDFMCRRSFSHLISFFPHSREPGDARVGETQPERRKRNVGKHVGGRYVDLGQFSDDE